MSKPPKSSNKTSVKSTKAEVDQRVSEITNLKLSGFTRSYIIQYGSKWGISDRQIDDYISMSTANIKEANQATLQDNLAMITTGLWEVYRKAKADGNLSEQHKVLMSLAKLKGLESYTVNHVIEDKRDHADLSDSDLDKLMEEAQRGQH